MEIWYIYTMEYYLDITNISGKWMELETVILNEVSQNPAKDKFCIFYMWVLDQLEYSQRLGSK